MVSNAGRVAWRKKPAVREAAFFYVCISPWILGFILFTAGPLIASILISFTRWNFISPSVFIGLENYLAAFDDDLFFKSLRVTTVYTFSERPAWLW